jgi:hypothetical protein
MLTGDADEPVDLALHNLCSHDFAKPNHAILDRVAQQCALPGGPGGGGARLRVLTRHKAPSATAGRGFAGLAMMDGFCEIRLNPFFARTMKPGVTAIAVVENTSGDGPDAVLRPSHRLSR